MNRFLPRLGWALIALLVLMLAGLVMARTLFARYLHSEAFRRSLGEGAANALHASRADFSPLEFDGSLVYGENFRAVREDGGGFSSIDADQLRATFDWHGLLHHTVQVDEMAIQRLTVDPPGPSAAGAAFPKNGVEETPAPLGGEGGEAAAHKGWTVDLRKAVISEANWHWSNDPAGGITGAAVTLTPAGRDAWIIDAQGGALRQTGWPALDIEAASMRWQAPTLFINSSSLRNGPGRLTVTGSVETRRSLSLLVNFDGVDVQPLLTPDWRERLSGRLTGRADVQAALGIGDEGTAGHAITVTGSAALTEGRLTALPILDQIGLFTHTERFRQLELRPARGPQLRRRIRGPRPGGGSVHRRERRNSRRLPGWADAGHAPVDSRFPGGNLYRLESGLPLDEREADRPGGASRGRPYSPPGCGDGQGSDPGSRRHGGRGEKGGGGRAGFAAALRSF